MRVALGCALTAVAVAAVGVPGAYASSGLGIERYALAANEEDGSPDTQAGSHPYELSAEVAFQPATGAPHDVRFELPSGMTLDPNAVPSCAIAEFVNNACPDSAAAGVAVVQTSEGESVAPIYELEPRRGTLGALGFAIDGLHLLAGITVRNGGGMTLSIDDIVQFVAVTSIKLTLWGVPSDSSHDPQRGKCLASHETTCQGAALGAFVTLPTSCAAGPDTTTAVLADSWHEPEGWSTGSASIPAMAGCNRLPFEGALSVAPEISEADTPTGFTLRLKQPQVEGPEGQVTAQLQNASVTLPPGVALSLSAGGGLTGCSESQFAAYAAESAVEPGGGCAEASKIGTVAIRSPLIHNPLQGAFNPLQGEVFLATPSANPLEALVGLYVVAEEPTSGLRIAFAGQMELDPGTGQVTLRFEDLPQLPIEDVELHLFGGSRALLVNPPTCGAATSVAHLLPWSADGDAAMEAEALSTFAVDVGINGTSCDSTASFQPRVRLEPTTVPAGGTSQLLIAVAQERGEQELSRFSVELPAGLAWTPAGIPPCGEPQAAAGTCPSSSRIGKAIVDVGPIPGLAWFSGTVYLTEGYGGGRYGLSIAFPAVAGPFDLGTLVVRAAIAESQPANTVTIESAPLPRIIDGIPLQTHGLEMLIERYAVIDDPTACGSGQLDATIESLEGGKVQVSDPFTVEGCAAAPTPSPGPDSPEGGTRPASPTPASKPSIELVREQLAGDRLLLTFTTSTAGSVTISGQGLRRYARRLHRGRHRIELALSRQGVFDTRHRRRLELELTLRAAGRSVSVRKTVLPPQRLRDRRPPPRGRRAV